MNNPLLSICIPTYNRASYLNKTIASIVRQKHFQETNEVEIVITDNFSDDKTREICEKYIQLYGEKIRYYQNSENIKDKNFEKVLSYGRGLYLKLNNDTLMHQDNTLDIIIDAINQNIMTKDIIFFSNLTNKNGTNLQCVNLNSFVKTVSFYSTWIACFGIWKVDFDSLHNFSRKACLQLVQTDVLFRLISQNRSVMVYNDKIFDAIIPLSKGGYNIYQVFVANYLSILNEYRVMNQISWITEFNEKSKLMRYFLIPWTLNIWVNKTRYSFEKKGALSIVFKEYWYNPILYFGIMYLFLRIATHKIIVFLKSMLKSDNLQS